MSTDNGFSEFQHVPGMFRVTPQMKQSFNDDGAFIIRQLLSKEEIVKIVTMIESDEEMMSKEMQTVDDTGSKTKLILWNNPGDDITGMVARSEKVAKTCEQVLEGEVYHYHSKLMTKPARVGGKHHWHQDYGYWYQNGCLRPDMMTVFIAIDRCSKENGCLQVIKASQRCGRIDHTQIEGQAQADPVRVDELLKHLNHLYVPLEPGDALFFHCNLLHCSSKNESDMRRWALLSAYNRADNDPVYKHQHAQYTPLHMVPDSAIMDCTTLTDLGDKAFMKPGDSKTSKLTFANDK